GRCAAVPLSPGRRPGPRRRRRADAGMGVRTAARPAQPPAAGAGGHRHRDGAPGAPPVGAGVPMTVTDRRSPADWRGRLDETPDDELPIDESVPRRREARALLGSLLRPYPAALVLLAVVVVVENLARLSVPLLVQRGIDHCIPPIVAGGSSRELLLIVAALIGVVTVQAASRMYFLRRSGRIGQEVLLELRRRLFRHFQRLDVAFHERYTSGRVVSRSTNDVEAIQDMLETGFDSLITAVLTLGGTAI